MSNFIIPNLFRHIEISKNRKTNIDKPIFRKKDINRYFDIPQQQKTFFIRFYILSHHEDATLALGAPLLVITDDQILVNKKILQKSKYSVIS